LPGTSPAELASGPLATQKLKELMGESNRMLLLQNANSLAWYFTVSLVAAFLLG
jgi:hypothetical protein